MLGFLVFAGIFALLAFQPRTLPGLWELSILHKAGMALLAAVAATGDAKSQRSMHARPLRPMLPRPTPSQ
jgi:hypothetical protein